MRYALTVLLLLVMASGAYAGDLIYAFTYEAAMPTGDTKDFIESMSPIGGGIEIRGFDNVPFPPGLSFSMSVHFNVFSDEVSYTPTGNLLLVAAGDNTEKRDMLVIPVLVHSDYNFTLLRDEPAAVPYIGVGAGGYWIKTETEIYGVAEDCSSWHFGLAPEAGVMITVSPKALLTIGARYNYAFNSDHPAQQFWTLSLGAVYNP
ncbi:hypothetical protein ACFL2Z_05390 [Candidatus Eisenbacteria bacterium]|uniref:Outer membrane protein beta-barrel domain-containing protein n=1 Tax=Eiseniibacteriota bacterium TaxID=2212470 RepID=A0ABV6YQG9_UNCEI